MRNSQNNKENDSFAPSKEKLEQKYESIPLSNEEETKVLISELECAVNYWKNRALVAEGLRKPEG